MPAHSRGMTGPLRWSGGARSCGRPRPWRGGGGGSCGGPRPWGADRGVPGQVDLGVAVGARRPAGRQQPVGADDLAGLLDPDDEVVAEVVRVVDVERREDGAAVVGEGEPNLCASCTPGEE